MTILAEEDFILGFHSLSGTTIGEKRRNLFLLLNETQKSCSEINFSHLQPRNALEENFKVEVLLYFRKTNDLIEVLKSENPILIDKILAARLFIKEAFGSMSGEQLVKQIFPHLSYITKLKLINKLSQHLENVQKAEEFFGAIKETYGFYLASKLLPACSDVLIIKSINSNRLEITPKQLLIIFKKYPLLIESIVEKVHQYNVEVDIAQKYKCVFMYLMKHDVSLFLRLNEKYNSTFCLGSRATSKFIRANKDIFIKNPKNIFKLLKLQKIGKYIKENMEELFLNVFPKSIEELKENMDTYLSLLDHLSDAEKLKLLLTAFQKTHGHEFLDHPAFMTPKIMEMMSPDDREVWLETHSRPDEITEETWISFMKIDKSLPLLKKKISNTSNIKDREKLIANLVITCKINKDLVALTNVCEYVFSKHRNDHIRIRQEFLSTISESFDLYKLECEQWKYIIDFIHLFVINQEYYHICNLMLEAYIYHCLKKELPVEEHLKEWSKMDYGRYNICQKKPEYQKKCLLMFQSVIPQCHKEKELEHRYMEYLRCLTEWNKRHPKDKISLFIDANAIDAIKTRMEKSEYTYPAEEIAARCIISDYNKSKEANLIHIFLNQQQDYNAYNVITSWLIKNHPLILLEYIEPLIQCLTKMYSPLNCLSPLFRYYTHLEIPQKIAAICLNIINAKDEDLKNKKVAVFILSHVMQPNDFLNFVSSYYPVELAMDIENNEGQEKYKLQQAISTSLRRVIPPFASLEAILNFCKGDYLKLIQKSMYAVVQNVAEERLAPFFDELMTRAVSVRKHTIFLAFKVMNKAKVYEVLAKFMESDKNASIRKHLFKGMFNFFMRNPDDYSWEMVKENIKAVDINDHEAFSKLTKHKRIPPQYFVQYILFTWDILEKLPPSDKRDEENRRILEAITAANVTLLPREFCKKLMEKHLFNSHDLTDFQKAINCFACKFIIYCKAENEQAETIKLLFSIIKDCMKTSLNSVANMIRHKLLLNLVQEFCSHIIIKECQDKKVLSLFLTSWNHSLQLHEAYNEYLLLQFTQIFLGFKDEKGSVQQIGEELALLCDSLHDKQLLDVNVFCKSLDFFRKHFFSENSEKDEKENELVLAESILKKSNSPSCLLLVLLLLPKDVLTAPKMKAQCDSIVEAIAKHPEPMIQIHLRDYLKNKESKEKA